MTRIAVFVTVVIFLHYIGILAPLERALRIPVNNSSGFVFSSSESLKNVSIYFSSKKEQAHKIETLRQDVANLHIDRAKLILLEDENKRLRESLNFNVSAELFPVGAETIGRSIDPIATTLIINKGAAEGVTKDNAVVVGNGALIGKIVEVFEHTSIVRLLNDTQSRIPSTVLNREHSIGVVEGGFGISVRLKFIPQNEEINPGDLIVTSGLDESTPRGLSIGVVEAVEKKPQEPFQQAILTPIHNLNDITVVTILTKKTTL